jgi:hypothetical protein
MAAFVETGRFHECVPFWWAGVVENEPVRKLFAEPPAPGTAEMDIRGAPGVQTYIAGRLEILEKLLPNSMLVLRDKYRAPAFDTRKPDVVGYLRNQAENEFHIALLGEVKSRNRWGNIFADDEMGQLESMLEDLLVRHRRQSVTGFLTDGKLIQFFRLRWGGSARRHVDSLELDATRVLYLATEGADALAALLALPDFVGLPPDTLWIGDGEVRFERVLGSGASAMVCAGTYKGEEVVVKKFHGLGAADEGQEDPMQMEMLVLGELKELAGSRFACVPKLVASDQMRRVLVEWPVGIRFVATLHELRMVQGTPQPVDWTQVGCLDEPLPLTATQFCQLVDILEKCHAKGFVHRDITFSNFYLNGTNGKVSTLFLFLRSFLEYPRCYSRIIEIVCGRRRSSSTTGRFRAGSESLWRSAAHFNSHRMPCCSI